MSRIYLPNSKQFQRINRHLDTIVNVLGVSTDTSTWEGVQKIVEMGLAPKYFPVGSQLTVNHSAYGDMVFDVVGHDYLKSVKDSNAHTMTILSHDTLPEVVQFDAPEAFYKNEQINAGIYNFTLTSGLYDWVAGTYSFDIKETFNFPIQLAIARPKNEGLTSAKVVVYRYGESEELCRVDISSGSSGKSLGTLGVELNHPQRVYSGSNNYAQSAVRQFLNSSATVGKVWSPTTPFDRPPSWKNSLAGFANGLEDDFLALISEVSLPCSRNSSFETSEFTAYSTYTLTTDKFYLPSQMEIVGNSDGINPDGSAVFPYYDEAHSSDRIKYQTGDFTPIRWLTRSPYRNTPSHVRCINTKGQIGETTEPSSVAVACTIVGRV